MFRWGTEFLLLSCGSNMNFPRRAKRGGPGGQGQGKEQDLSRATRWTLCLAFRANGAGPCWIPGETVNQHGQAWRRRVRRPARTGPKGDRWSRSRGGHRDSRPQGEPQRGWVLQSLLCPSLARGPLPTQPSGSRKGWNRVAKGDSPFLLAGLAGAGGRPSLAVTALSGSVQRP